MQIYLQNCNINLFNYLAVLHYETYLCITNKNSHTTQTSIPFNMLFVWFIIKG